MIANLNQQSRLLILIAGMLAAASTKAEPAFLTNGLVCYYPFSGNASDASGHGLDPSAANVSFVQDRFSNNGSAAAFDGLNSMVLIPHSEIPPLDYHKGLTISAWVKANTRAQIPVVEFSDTNAVGVHLWLNAITTGVLFENLRDAAPLDHYSISTNFPIGTNRFQHIFTTYDYSAGKLSFFVDGAPAGTFNVGQIAFDTSEDIRIGFRSYAYNAAHFNGVIDDLRIYNRSFKDDEIQALHLRENALPEVHGAVVTAQVVNGFLVGAIVADGGAAYTNTPGVRIVGGGGSGAAAHAVVVNGAVSGIVVDDAGTGYTNSPGIVIDPPPQTRGHATGVAAIANGQVTGVSPVLGGFGYSLPPVVRLTGGGGSGATAAAILDADGQVTAITLISPGSGYTNAPTVLIASPPAPASLSVAVSRVTVTMSVILGSRYQLESSVNLSVWNPVGTPFVAESETILQDFDVNVTGQFFRLVEVP